MIDTKGTGLIVDPTVVFGKVWGFETRATDFLRSADGSEISFSCAGWCGGCGPVSGPIKLVHSVEFNVRSKVSAMHDEPVIYFLHDVNESTRVLSYPFWKVVFQILTRGRVFASALSIKT
uniref:Uncharacterized protein n=1 Tax=Magallana gigas TaxID=29159 RepID=K1R8H5_MAGGI